MIHSMQKHTYAKFIPLHTMIHMDFFLYGITKALDEVAPYRALSNMCFMSSPRVRTALRYKRRLFRDYNNNASLPKLVAYTKSLEIAKNVIMHDAISRKKRMIATCLMDCL